jgi:hypothetical protein
MQTPFAAALSNTFINGRGEIATNLDSSKSKVAEKIRKDRDYKERKSAFLRETKEMRKEIVFCRDLVTTARKEGMKLQGESRTEKFQIAAQAEKRAKFLQEEISKLAKKHNIK